MIDLHSCVSVCAVPCEEDVSVSFPMGLALLDNFVSPEEEASLLSAVDWSSGNDVTGKLQLWVSFCLFLGYEFCLRQTSFTVTPPQLKKP